MKKLEEIKVTLWEKKQHLCEIGQVTGIQYAFLSPDNKQCHPWVKCRDFLHDALRSHVTGNKENIFGFHYESGVNPPLDTDHMRVMVQRQNSVGEKDFSKNTEKMINSAINIVHCIEKHSKMDPSKLYRVAGNEGMYIFEGASDWMASTFMISLYTFLIRLGGKKITFKGKKDLDTKLEELLKTNSDHDIQYLKTVHPFMYNIIKNREKLKYVREDGKRLLEDQSVNLFHNYSGIVSLCNEANKKKSGQKEDSLKELRALSKCIGEGV